MAELHCTYLMCPLKVDAPRRSYKQWEGDILALPSSSLIWLCCNRKLCVVRKLS